MAEEPRSLPGTHGPPPSELAGGRFQLGRRLAAGAFAEVYLATDRQRGGAAVAAKVEDYRDEELQLEHEAEVLELLAGPDGLPQGFPTLLHAGEEGNLHFCAILELLGPSLSELLQSCGGRFGAETAGALAQQAVRRLEYLHSKGLVYRDVKPENFLIGLAGKAHHLYLIDFGLSTRFYVKDRHVEMKCPVGVVGTPRYASINALKSKQQSRRDDLEALGYLLLYLCRGSVPWSNLGGESREEHNRRIAERKEAIPVSELCKGLPEAFSNLLRSARKLTFTARPDYSAIVQQFRDFCMDEGDGDGNPFPWATNSSDFEALEDMEDIRQPDDDELLASWPMLRRLQNALYCSEVTWSKSQCETIRRHRDGESSDAGSDE